LADGWPPEFDIVEYWGSVGRIHQGTVTKKADGGQRWDSHNSYGYAQTLQPAGESAALRPSSAAAPKNYGPRAPKLVSKPNIVFILADDLADDLGCYGSSFYDTPNLDKLAKQGALFTDAYAACPVCSPTRASLMSGQYPQRTGLSTAEGWPTSN